MAEAAARFQCHQADVHGNESENSGLSTYVLDLISLPHQSPFALIANSSAEVRSLINCPGDESSPVASNGTGEKPNPSLSGEMHWQTT